jgi:hypothetical protein
MEHRGTRFWIGSVATPAAVFAIAYLFARGMKAVETDWLGGRFILVTLVACVAAVLGSVVFTIASVKSGEKMSGLAIAACIISLGLCAKLLF